MILKLYDTEEHFIFNVAGLQPAYEGDRIYCKVGASRVDKTRQEVAILWKNVYAEPSLTLPESVKKQLSPQDLADITPRPYNPIERE